MGGGGDAAHVPWIPRPVAVGAPLRAFVEPPHGVRPDTSCHAAVVCPSARRTHPPEGAPTEAGRWAPPVPWGSTKDTNEE